MKISAILLSFIMYVILGLLNIYLWRHEDEIIQKLVQEDKNFGDCFLVLGMPRILFLMITPIIIVLLFLLIGGKL